MKKVLFIVNSLPFFLSHRKAIADELVKQGYEVHLAAGKMNATPPEQFIWHELPLERGGTNPLRELRTIISIYQVISKVKPDLIHLVSTKPVLYGGIISRLFPSVPVVSAISGLGSIFTNKEKFKTLRLIISLLYKMALKRNKLIAIFQNSDDQLAIQTLTNIEKEKTRLIRGSGVDLKQYQFSNEPNIENGIKVTMASRLLKDKGIVEFIEASQLLKSEPITFSIIGDIDPQNPESLSQEDLSKYKKLSNIIFEGYKNNIEDYFSKSHIITLPSYREGLPKVLCEAAAAGRAVITTDVPGCRDAITENVTGFLVPVKNSLQLSQTILRLSLDHELRNQMGKNGRALAENEFDIHKIIEKHFIIYRELGL